MNNDNLENLFDNLKNEFDSEVPNKNHEQRFLSKLKNQRSPEVENKSSFWRPLIGIAASIVLIITLVINNKQDTNTTGLASVSPEFAETQDFFTSTIILELKKLEAETGSNTSLLIKDALTQIKRLETEYESLKNDLTESGNDQRVIYAMITNFQNRIEILQNTLKQIERVKQLNNITNEKSNTI